MSEFRYRQVSQKLFKIFASQKINDPIHVKVRLHDDNFSLDSVSTRAFYTLCYTASEFYQSVSIATATRSFNLEARYNARTTTSQTHVHHGCNIYIYLTGKANKPAIMRRLIARLGLREKSIKQPMGRDSFRGCSTRREHLRHHNFSIRYKIESFDCETNLEMKAIASYEWGTILVSCIRSFR